jgi:ribonuclease BN (tRNA processing enzyme)
VGEPVEDVAAGAWILGSGGWFPTDARETTCVLLRQGDRALLLDAGTGVRRLLTDPTALRGVSAIDVVLTHFHLDHVCGLLYLPGLFSVSQIASPPRLWGPGEWLFDTPSEQLLERILSPPVSPFVASVLASVHELGPGTQAIGEFAVTALKQQRHWGPTVGLRVDDALALITDTGHQSEHAGLADGVAHLLHEAWSTSANPIFSDYDATARDAANTAAAARVGSLALIHLNPLQLDPDALLADATEIFPPTILGDDGMALSGL